jgi:hypothetical protein
MKPGENEQFVNLLTSLSAHLGLNIRDFFFGVAF